MRRLLGYHVKGKDAMLVLYSRDALGPPLRAAQAVLAEIRTGTFRPDADRSGRILNPFTNCPADPLELFVDEASRPSGGTATPQAAAVDSDDEEDYASLDPHDPRDSDLDDPEEFESSEEDEGAGIVPDGDDVEFLRNMVTGKYHVLVDGTTPACGRRWPLHFEIMSEGPHDPERMCKPCVIRRG